MRKQWLGKKKTEKRKKREGERYRAADFEATTDENDCRVWLWGVADVGSPDEIIHGIDIESFVEFISGKGSITYFHNLKYDGHFIIDHVMKQGFVHMAGANSLSPGQFTTLISDKNQFYSIKIKWQNGTLTEFRDSLKKIPLSLANISKAFKLKDAKGELDYKLFRPIGHTPTDEELEYLKLDVSILAQALQVVLESGMKKLTVGADSLAEFKKLSGKKFDVAFPVLDETMDAEIRRAYRGGFTYADSRFSGRKVRSGIVLDVNSLYPSVMRYNVLPYGEPEYIRGKVVPTSDRPLTIFAVTFTAKLKPDHIPVIQIKGHFRFAGTEYLSEISEPTTMMVTNVDWDLFNDHYDIQVQEYGGGWAFQGVRGFFDEYIDKWMEVKARETGGKREIAKLHLNALYGKFATNPNVTGKIPVLTDEGFIRYELGEHETREPIYTAMGVFITAYARDLTIRAAQTNYGTFAYADTDSLHLLTDEVPADIDVHPSRIGAWKFEYAFESAWYVRPKVYLERQSDGTYHNAFAGLPEKVSKNLTFDDLTPGRVISGKLSPKSVPGGIVLKDVDFTLNL